MKYYSVQYRVSDTLPWNMITKHFYPESAQVTLARLERERGNHQYDLRLITYEDESMIFVYSNPRIFEVLAQSPRKSVSSIVEIET